MLLTNMVKNFVMILKYLYKILLKLKTSFKNKIFLLDSCKKRKIKLKHTHNFKNKLKKKHE